MSDDLVNRLREYCDGNNDLMDAAADRIEALEAVLRLIFDNDRNLAQAIGRIVCGVLHQSPRCTRGEER